jgi:hypothetical protein
MTGEQGPEGAAMFEIWRHVATGERYLVALHDHQVLAAAGPLMASEDPVQTLASHANQRHNPRALLAMTKARDDDVREYTSTLFGHVVQVPDPPAG